MKLTQLTNKLIELGLPEVDATNLELAHNRYIRSMVDNRPTTGRITEFMADFRDEHGNEIADLAIANGAIMYFSKAKMQNVEFGGKVQERIAKESLVQDILVQYQSKNNHPEYDELSVPAELFDL